MNTRSLTILTISVVAAVAVILGVAAATQSRSSADACTHTGTAYTMTIQHNTISPSHIDGQRCDTLKIVNRDTVTREIGFGAHEHHTPYDGVTERVLHQGESFTVTLSETGKHGFHDHFHDEVAATFTVR